MIAALLFIGLLQSVAQVGASAADASQNARSRKVASAQVPLQTKKSVSGEKTANRIILAVLQNLFSGSNREHKPWLTYISAEAGGLNPDLKQSIAKMGIATVDRKWRNTLPLRPPDSDLRHVYFLYIEILDLQMMTKHRAKVEILLWRDYNPMAEGYVTLYLNHRHHRWVVDEPSTVERFGE